MVNLAISSDALMLNSYPKLGEMSPSGLGFGGAWRRQTPRNDFPLARTTGEGEKVGELGCTSSWGQSGYKDVV